MSSISNNIDKNNLIVSTSRKSIMVYSWLSYFIEGWVISSDVEKEYDIPVSIFGEESPVRTLADNCDMNDVVENLELVNCTEPDLCLIEKLYKEWVDWNNNEQEGELGTRFTSYERDQLKKLNKRLDVTIANFIDPYNGGIQYLVYMGSADILKKANHLHAAQNYIVQTDNLSALQKLHHAGKMWNRGLSLLPEQGKYKCVEYLINHGYEPDCDDLAYASTIGDIKYLKFIDSAIRSTDRNRYRQASLLTRDKGCFKHTYSRLTEGVISDYNPIVDKVFSKIIKEACIDVKMFGPTSPVGKVSNDAYKSLEILKYSDADVCLLERLSVQRKRFGYGYINVVQLRNCFTNREFDRLKELDIKLDIPVVRDMI